MRLHIIFICIVSLLVTWPITAVAWMRQQTKIRVGTPPYEVVAQILRTNTAYSAEGPAKPLPATAAPHLTWLAASDSRLQATAILANHQDRIYPVRNLGPRLADVLPSVDHGIRNLHTPILLITAIGDRQPAGMAGWPPASQLSAQPPPKPDLPMDRENHRWTELESAIDQQAAIAVQRYRERIDNGRLVVLGSIMDYADHYHCGTGRLIIININGETEESALRRHPVAAKLNKEMLKMLGREQQR